MLDSSFVNRHEEMVNRLVRAIHTQLWWLIGIEITAIAAGLLVAKLLWG